MGMERGAANGVQSNGYQRGAGAYHRNSYRDSNYGGYGNGKLGHGVHYDNGKYDNSSKVDRTNSEQANGVTGADNTTNDVTSDYQNGTAAKGQTSNRASAIATENSQSSSAPAQEEVPLTIASLERKLSAMQEEMNKALEESSQKEKKKFDLIFSILTELQSRQSQLDQSMKFIKDHVATGGMGNSMSNVSDGSSASQGQQMTGAMTMPNGGQVVMIGPGMGMGHMGMSQFGSGMMMIDGSGNMITPVMVAMPQGGGQMQFMNSAMMPQGVGMPVPQQMMQMMQGGEGSGDFQWVQNMQMMGNHQSGDGSTATGSAGNSSTGSGSGDDTARSGDQHSEQEAAAHVEKGKIDLMTHEEE